MSDVIRTHTSHDHIPTEAELIPNIQYGSENSLRIAGTI